MKGYPHSLKYKKKLHLPSPFAKTNDLFWPDFPKLHFFVEHWDAIWGDLVKINQGFLCVEREDVAGNSNFLKFLNSDKYL